MRPFLPARLGGRAVPRRTAARLGGVIVAGLVVLGLATSLVAAASARTWVARFGTGGADGTAVLSVSSSGAGTLTVALRGLPAGSAVAGSVRRGTCAKQGSAVAAFPAGRATATGRFSKRRTLSTAEVAAVTAAPGLVVTVRAGSIRRCAALVERVAPPPSPTPSPSATAAPTPTPTPTATPSALPGLLQNVMVGGVAYLAVEKVLPFTDAVGGTGVLVKVRFEAFSAGLRARSEDFRLRVPGGALHLPIYAPDAPDLPDFWAVTLPNAAPYEDWLLFAAPVLGPLDLVFDGSFGSATFHIRD